jgi:hypothetical protein
MRSRCSRRARTPSPPPESRTTASPPRTPAPPRSDHDPARPDRAGGRCALHRKHPKAHAASLASPRTCSCEPPPRSRPAPMSPCLPRPRPTPGPPPTSPVLAEAIEPRRQRRSNAMIATAPRPMTLDPAGRPSHGLPRLAEPADGQPRRPRPAGLAHADRPSQGGALRSPLSSCMEGSTNELAAAFRGCRSEAGGGSRAGALLLIVRSRGVMRPGRDARLPGPSGRANDEQDIPEAWDGPQQCRGSGCRGGQGRDALACLRDPSRAAWTARCDRPRVRDRWPEAARAVGFLQLMRHVPTSPQ